MIGAMSWVDAERHARRPAATPLLALVVPEPPTRVFSDDPFFPSLIQGVSDQLQETGQHPVLIMANSTAGHDHVRRYVLEGRVAGVMLASLHGHDPLPLELHRMGVPVVAMERPLGGGSTPPIVGVDSISGATAAARHLLERGRRRIATICGPQDMPAGIDRLAGLRAGLGTAGLVAVAAGDFTRESGEGAMRQLLDAAPDLDAVFVASDLMALGALQALRASGRSVPHDVAVIGFDDSPAACYADPPLSTIRQPVVELGRLLARQLVRIIDGERIEDALILSTELVVRSST